MGGCATKCRELNVTDDSFNVHLQPGTVAFFGFTLTQQWLNKKQDLVIRCHVLKGRLDGVYCARDRSFPQQRRKLWSTTRYCQCPSAECDHCYPSCLNASGGLCAECMTHDEKFERRSHEPQLGGLASEQVAKHQAETEAAQQANEAAALEDAELAAEIAEAAARDAAAGRIPDPPYPHQTDCEFNLRLSPTSPHDAPALTQPGHFFLSLVAAPEKVPRALRKQRRREGEEERHETIVLLWMEERTPRQDPRAGNAKRVAEVQQVLQEKAEVHAARIQLQRRMDEEIEVQQKKEQEERIMREMGLPSDEEKKEHRTNKTVGIAVTSGAMDIDAATNPFNPQ